MNNIDLNKYTEFVKDLTAKPWNDLTEFHNSLDRLDGNYEMFAGEDTMRHGPDLNVPLLIGASMGLCGEAGEFSEIVKKTVFHGKLFDEAARLHAIKELGDIIFYWINACRSLGVDPNEVIQTNVEKLQNRHPNGVFDATYQTDRTASDV